MQYVLIGRCFERIPHFMNKLRILVLDLAENRPYVLFLPSKAPYRFVLIFSPKLIDSYQGITLLGQLPLSCQDRTGIGIFWGHLLLKKGGKQWNKEKRENGYQSFVLRGKREQG
jgi:hypothetical protein